MGLVSGSILGTRSGSELRFMPMPYLGKVSVPELGVVSGP